MFRSVFDVFEKDKIFGFLLVILVGTVLGIITCASYMFYRRKGACTKGLPIMLVILPPVIACLIGLTNLRNSEVSIVATGGLILTGMFALTRFRSDPLSIIDLTFVVIVSMIGMGCGMGYLTYTAIVTIIIMVIFFVLCFLQIGQAKNNEMILRMYVPEDCHYETAFEEVLSKHCLRYVLIRSRTTDGGQLFELKYQVFLRPDVEQKVLIDDLRVINGNLDIFLTNSSYEN